MRFRACIYQGREHGHTGSGENQGPGRNPQFSRNGRALAVRGHTDHPRALRGPFRVGRGFIPGTRIFQFGPLGPEVRLFLHASRFFRSSPQLAIPGLRTPADVSGDRPGRRLWLTRCLVLADPVEIDARSLNSVEPRDRRPQQRCDDEAVKQQPGAETDQQDRE